MSTRLADGTFFPPFEATENPYARDPEFLRTLFVSTMSNLKAMHEERAALLRRRRELEAELLEALRGQGNDVY